MVFEEFVQNDFLRAFLILVVLLIFIRVGLFLLEKVVLRAVSKTKTDLDDIIVRKSSMPLTITAFLISLTLALGELSLSEDVLEIVERLILTAGVIVIGYLIYVLLDSVVVRAWQKFTEKTDTTLDDSLTPLIHSVLRIAAITIVTLYILDVWGVQIGPLLAGLGLAGLAVALALQPTLSNIFSGISMIFDKSVGVEDLVYLDANTSGKISKIGLRSTQIRTFNNELIIVPNSKLADSIIQNVALPEPKTRVVIPFSVAYGSDIGKVKNIVFKEIKTLKHVIKEPAPHIKFMEMADSSLNFNAYFYIDSFENRLESKDEANTKIYNALGKAEIEIPFPQRDVHMKK
jgi:MscS family membrane protein